MIERNRLPYIEGELVSVRLEGECVDDEGETFQESLRW